MPSLVTLWYADFRGKVCSFVNRTTMAPSISSCTDSFRAVGSVRACLLFLLAISPSRADSQNDNPLVSVPGTYDITWYSIDTTNEKPTIAKLVLVIAPTPFADSLAGRMKSGLTPRAAAPSARVCWRVTSGLTALSGESAVASGSDWTVSGTNEVSIQLW